MEIEDFDDEFLSIKELMDQGEISLNDGSFKRPISSLSRTEPIVVSSGSTVDQCIRTMLENHIGCVLVVEGQQLKGIFTERDVLMKIVGIIENVTTVSVDKFMTPNPAALRLNDPLTSALSLMDKGGYRHVPVVNDKNQPAAVVSVKDIVSYIVDFFPQDVLNLPPHPIRVGTKKREGG
ncbi:MAG: cyclic nucleotide-binding/CBS domain-containing protein [bacterium]